MEQVSLIFSIIISFISSFILAKFLSRIKSFRYINERVERYGSLDGIRGFLALGVFVNHFVITWYWKEYGSWQNPPYEYVVMFGRVGVSVFFMITGFLFISKILKSKSKIKWYEFYESRVFRIYPVYFLALVIVSFLVFFKMDFNVSSSSVKFIKEYVSWILFIGATINSFEDATLIIAQVYWTLKYEWVFYLLLPFISIIIHRFQNKGGRALLLASIVLFLFPVNFFNYFSSDAFILFALGGVAAFQYKKPSPIVAYLMRINFFKSSFATILSLLLLSFSIFIPQLPTSVLYAFLFLVFLLLVFGNNYYSFLDSPASIVLSEISYSIYLLHGVVLYVCFSLTGFSDPSQLDFSIYVYLMPFVSLLIIAVSSCTFIFVERPGIKIGNKFFLSKLIRRTIR